MEKSISHQIWRWRTDACSVFMYFLSIVTASICLDVVGGSFFLSVKASNNDPHSGFAHFLPENTQVKKQFSDQLSFLLLHLDGCDSLTFIQVSLYIQDNSDFPFSQFFHSAVHPPIFPVSPNTSFNAPTQCEDFASQHFLVSKAIKSHLLSSHDSRRLWCICKPLARILNTFLDT